ncbi:MAG: 4Fe-4S binding protein [Oscillospiraceae bacterium]|nr:4Fe-4S binding protein [Oscillospiraceae bacterium]
MTSREVKEIVSALGAELCGVASLDRFSDAPEGYHPLDVWPECRSVVSFACRFPAAAVSCRSDVVYTRVRNSITAKMDAIALDLCIEMEKHGVPCVPIPANESQWDERTGRWRSIISQKHAAQAAGVGTIGRHSLLITPELGSLVWLGCVLCGAELEADAMQAPLCNDCGKCVEVCPVNALDGEEVAQQVCWGHAFGDDQEKQVWRISCHACRDVCPFCLGRWNGGREVAR